MADLDGMRCVPMCDESGEVIAHARVTEGVTDEFMAALHNVIDAVLLLNEQEDAEVESGRAG